jgi:pimeloyl-ACP methyl ester carboxylesterase
MSLQRLTANGVQRWDATTLHAMAMEGIDWVEAGEWLGDRNRRIAAQAQQYGHLITARTYFYYASSCYRAAQAAIAKDSERKCAIYRKLIDTFGDAGALEPVPTQHWHAPFGAGRLSGWLLRPAKVERPPVVVVVGGFDAWREEYHIGATYLVERGIAVLLVDAPGQGETRLFNGLTMTSDFENAFACVYDALQADISLGGQVGLWGNSFGGFLAAKVAALDKRWDAVCVNGGTTRPAAFPQRFPRFVDRITPLLGAPDDDAALVLIEAFDIDDLMPGITRPLLQLHSAVDPIFTLEEATRVHDQATSDDKKLLVWEDGDHCIHSHFIEKYNLVADWFVSRLNQA